MMIATAIPDDWDAILAVFEPTISCTQSRNVNHYTMTPIKRQQGHISLAIKRPGFYSCFPRCTFCLGVRHLSKNTSIMSKSATF